MQSLFLTTLHSCSDHWFRLYNTETNLMFLRLKCLCMKYVLNCVASWTKKKIPHKVLTISGDQHYMLVLFNGCVFFVVSKGGGWGGGGGGWVKTKMRTVCLKRNILNFRRSLRNIKKDQLLPTRVGRLSHCLLAKICFREWVADIVCHCLPHISATSDSDFFLRSCVSLVDHPNPSQCLFFGTVSSG